MAGAVIGALRVVLGADTAVLETKLKDASSSLSAFGANIQKFGMVAASGLAGAAVGLGYSIKKTIDSADQIQKVSEKIGIPVEELSALKYAAELADVPMETLSKSVVKLSKAMAEAARDPASEAARAFAAIGVAVKNSDGTLRNSGSVISDIAEKFAGYRDSAEKTALAVAIFGKAGAEMIPLLNAGRAGLEQAATEAKRYGVVLSDETAQAAQAFNDNLKKMSTITQGIVTQITAEMLPAFKGLSDAMLTSKENSALMKTAADGLVVVLRTLVSVTVGGMVAFNRLGAEAVALVQVLKSINDFMSEPIMTGDMAGKWAAVKKAWSEFSTEGEKTQQTMQGLKGTIASFWENGTISTGVWEGQIAGLNNLSAAVKRYAETWTQTTAPVIAAAAGQKNALETFISSQEKRRQSLEAEAQTIGKAAGEQERLRIILQAETIAKENNIVITDALRARIEQTAEAYGAVATRVELAKQKFQSMQELQQFAGQQMVSVFSDLITGADSFANSMKRVTNAIINAILQAMILGNGPLASLFGMQGTAGNTGGFLGLLFGSLKLPGFASGGSFEVGGSGGIDSQLTAFMATPGERVTVSTGRGGHGGGPVTVNVMNAPAGTSADVKTSRDANGGMRIDVRLLDDMIAGVMSRGDSSTNKVIERAYGLDRTRGMAR